MAAFRLGRCFGSNGGWGCEVSYKGDGRTVNLFYCRFIQSVL